ncbi:hypothetical protein [Plantactinospora soyae]|uniref:Nitroreductase n=1 Tax=Plantactinospora soyae TaxID=1544732 RepID=A0A927RBC1_9ACTN|nr:hypothetical protein [Plantactinospora soyae]MBE1491536.1 hypothetical protein [Plantactinospora soyae]
MDVEAFRALAPLCWRAPSAHNTQPWRLHYDTGAVRVGWDPADALPAADPTGRDLRLSLGAFVETCLVVAADAGLAVRFEADHCAEERRVGWLRGARRRYDTPFGAAGVRDRRTHRGRYLTGAGPEVVAAPAPRAALATQLGVAPERLLHVVRVGRPAMAAAPSARRRDAR